MVNDTFCGLVLSGDAETRCAVAFLSDELETFTEKDDQRLLELIEERTPMVVAFTVPPEGSNVQEGFRENEKDMVEISDDIKEDHLLEALQYRSRDSLE